MIVSSSTGVWVGVSGVGVAVFTRTVGDSVALGCEVLVASSVALAAGSGDEVGELVAVRGLQAATETIRQMMIKSRIFQSMETSNV